LAINISIATVAKMNTARLSIAPESRIPREDIVKKNQKHKRQQQQQIQRSIRVACSTVRRRNILACFQHVLVAQCKKPKRFLFLSPDVDDVHYRYNNVNYSRMITGEFYIPKVKPELVCRVICSLSPTKFMTM
jgi:hypothetical protein